MLNIIQNLCIGGLAILSMFHSKQICDLGRR